MLEGGSGILPEVYEESKVRSIAHGRELPDGFSPRQRRLGSGLLFTVHRPDGTTCHSFRPDEPDKPGRKYEQQSRRYGGPGNVLYVHPVQRHLIGDLSVPVIYVEGIKKALSIISAARRAGARVLVVAISGVWNFLSGGEPIPDLLGIPVEGREVGIVFDSDILTKPGPQGAAVRLAETEISRGAKVRMAFLPDTPDGSKVGADDFLVSGKTYAELRMTMRAYDPGDFALIKLSRDDKLRAGIRWLLRDWRDRDWMRFVGAAEKENWQRGHTARDAKEALIRLVAKTGRWDGRGLIVEVGLRRLSDLAAKTAPSVGDAIKHLAADGQLEILPAEGKGKPRRYRLLVPSAALYSIEGGNAEGEEFGETDPGCKGLRYPSAPNLRWSSPARPGALVRHVEGATGRAVTEAIGENIFVPPDYRPYAHRLGPHRKAVLDALEDAGGRMDLKELCEVLRRKRPWDVRRRILKPLEEAGIIECEGDVIVLAAEWLAKLDEQRERDGEVEQAEKQAKRHKRESADYRLELERRKHGTPKASIEGVRRGRELRERRMREAFAEEERAADLGAKTFSKRFVHRTMRKLPQISLGTLEDLLREEGGVAAHAEPAAWSLGCTVERRPEYGNREIVYPPTEWREGAA